MLNSATLAGIAASNIVIALEPEGAVLACLENEVCEVLSTLIKVKY